MPTLKKITNLSGKWQYTLLGLCLKFLLEVTLAICPSTGKLTSVGPFVCTKHDLLLLWMMKQLWKITVPHHTIVSVQHIYLPGLQRQGNAAIMESLVESAYHGELIVLWWKVMHKPSGSASRWHGLLRCGSGCFINSWWFWKIIWE